MDNTIQYKSKNSRSDFVLVVETDNTWLFGSRGGVNIGRRMPSG